MTVRRNEFAWWRKTMRFLVWIPVFGLFLLGGALLFGSALLLGNSVADASRSEPAGRPTRPALAWDGENFALAWANERPRQTTIDFARVGPSGDVLTRRQLSAPGTQCSQPSLRVGSRGFGVAWGVRSHGHPTSGRFIQLDAHGENRSPIHVLRGPFYNARSFRVGRLRQGYVVAWESARLRTDHEMLFTMRLARFADGGAEHSEVALYAPEAADNQPATMGMVSGGDEVFVSWARSTQSITRVRMTAQGESTTENLETGQRVRALSFAGEGAQQAVLFRAERNRLYFGRLGAEAGWRLAPRYIGEEGVASALDWGPSGVFAAWSNDGRINAMRLSEDGTGTAFLVGVEASPHEVAIAVGQDQVTIAWVRHVAATRELRLSRFSPTGVRLGPDTIVSP